MTSYRRTWLDIVSKHQVMSTTAGADSSISYDPPSSGGEGRLESSWDCDSKVVRGSLEPLSSVWICDGRIVLSNATVLMLGNRAKYFVVGVDDEYNANDRPASDNSSAWIADQSMRSALSTASELSVSVVHGIEACRSKESHGRELGVQDSEMKVHRPKSLGRELGVQDSETKVHRPKSLGRELGVQDSETKVHRPKGLGRELGVRDIEMKVHRSKVLRRELGVREHLTSSGSEQVITISDLDNGSKSGVKKAKPFAQEANVQWAYERCRNAYYINIDFNKIAARSNTCVLDIGQIYSIIIANKGCRKEVDQIYFDAIETSTSATTTIESVDELDQICFDAIETSTSAATIESVGVSKSSILKLIEEMTLLKDQSFAIKTIAKNIQGGRYYKTRMSFGIVELKETVVFSHETFGSVELKGTVVFSHETMSSTSSVQEVAEAVERPRLQTYIC